MQVRSNTKEPVVEQRIRIVASSWDVAGEHFTSAHCACGYQSNWDHDPKVTEAKAARHLARCACCSS